MGYKRKNIFKYVGDPRMAYNWHSQCFSTPVLIQNITEQSPYSFPFRLQLASEFLTQGYFQFSYKGKEEAQLYLSFR